MNEDLAKQCHRTIELLIKRIDWMYDTHCHDTRRPKSYDGIENMPEVKRARRVLTGLEKSLEGNRIE